MVRLPGENVLVNHYPVYRDVLLALFDHPLYSFTPVFQELVQGYGIYSAFKDILSGGFGIGEEQRLFIKQIIASICENRNTLLSVNDYAIAPRTDDFRWSSAVIPSREFKDSITSRINYYVHPRALGGNKSIRVPFGSTGVVSRGTGESLQFKLMLLHRVSLLSDSTQSEPSHSCIHYRDVYDDPFSPEKPWQRFFFGFLFALGGFRLATTWAVNRRTRWLRWLCIVVGMIVYAMGTTILLFGHAWPPKSECSEYSEYRQIFQHDGGNVS